MSDKSVDWRFDREQGTEQGREQGMEQGRDHGGMNRVQG